MVKKIYIQIFLFSIILVSLVWFYNKYFNKKNEIQNNTNLTQEKDTSKSKSNLIYNLNYKSTDLENNTYMIKSDSGEISENGDDFYEHYLC